MEVMQVAGADLTGWAFDYETMAADVAQEARAVVDRHRARSRAYFMDTGRDLIAIKERLEHGLFQKWVEAEIGLPIRTAQNFMRAASALGHKSETVAHLPQGVLYQLAAQSTPAPLREEIVSRIESGEPLSPHQIRGIVAKARKEAREQKEAAKLSPEERRLQVKRKKEREARRQREHQEYLRETEDRTKQKKDAAAELAVIMVAGLDEESLRRAYKLLGDVDSYMMRAAIVEQYGPTFDQTQDAALEPADA